eukprot:362255-Chlamydomonas_euryale.AAC.2
MINPSSIGHGNVQLGADVGLPAAVQLQQATGLLVSCCAPQQDLFTHHDTAAVHRMVLFEYCNGALLYSACSTGDAKKLPAPSPLLGPLYLAALSTCLRFVGLLPATDSDTCICSTSSVAAKPSVKPWTLRPSCVAHDSCFLSGLPA